MSDQNPNEKQKPTEEYGLAGWAIWAFVFSILSITIVGGLIGGLIAGVISYIIMKAIPNRPDGKKLPTLISIIILIAAVVIFIVWHIVLF